MKITRTAIMIISSPTADPKATVVTETIVLHVFKNILKNIIK